MKRKLLFVSLVAALSTVGYAYTLPHENAASGTSGFIGHKLGNDNFNSLAGAVNNLENQVSNNTATTTVNSELIGKLTEQMDQKADKEEFDHLKNEVNGNSQALGEMGKDIVNLENNKADKEEFDHLKNEVNGNSQALGELGKDIVALGKENDKQNDRLDAAEDRLDLGDRIDAVQNQQIGGLQTENVEQNNRLDKVEKENGKQNAAIEANKNQIEQNRQDIAKGDQINKVQNQQIGALQTENVEQNNRLDKVEKENGKQNDRLDKVEDKNTEQDKAIEKEQADRIAADEKLAAQMDKFQGQMNNYGSRIDNLEKRVDNLDNKLNKGLSLMAAMNAVDFQDVSEGEMAIGAGVGHYGNAQSVAIGVAYAPTQNLNVNMKYSVTAGDVDSFAIGAGASYKFRVK